MKVRVLDREVLGSVVPLSLSFYAKAQGWQIVGEYTLGGRSFGHIYSHKRKNAEIVIPSSSHFSDYAAVVADAIGAMSKIEGRDELQILKDIQVAAADVLRVVALKADEAGSIPIEAGVHLFRSSHDLLLAAACAVDEKKRVFTTAKNTNVTDYMKKVRFGQTEIGSFVVTLLSPVPPLLDTNQQPDLWPDLALEPFERRVTRVLGTALERVKQTVERVSGGGGIEEFEESVDLGVSANLCSAASKLIESGRGLNISLTWAKSRQTPQRRATYSFRVEDSHILSDAAKLLKKKAPLPDSHLTGFVTQLMRSEDQVPGTITVKAIVDGHLSSVKTTLNEDAYSLATTAHNNREPISITGDLVREGQRWRLNNPRELMIKNEVDED